MGIKRLSVQLANQIAAGEVVERPASVVKELLENAVDAGSTSITLEIRNSGKTLVKVTDNGNGIPADELPLALAPHATSKIHTLEDLSAIRTLGFRGEALASIASVSKLTLVSRTATADHAYQVEVTGAEQNPIVEPAVHTQGTSVIVRELFFNTPARRRFLKSDKTEFNHIKELITKIALVNCDIEFKFISDGKTIINVPAHGKVKMEQRIAALLGSDFKHNLLSFDNTNDAFVRRYNDYKNYIASSGWAYKSFANNDDYDTDSSDDSLNSKLLQMHGVLLRPPANRSLPDRLLTFLNGRCIADRTVNHAIREAFLNVLQGNSEVKPCVRGVIFLQCDPHIVDVNVHPRKDEVRFHNSNLIHDCIRNNVYAVLAIAGLNDKNASQNSFELDNELDILNEQSLKSGSTAQAANTDATEPFKASGTGESTGTNAVDAALVSNALGAGNAANAGSVDNARVSRDYTGSDASAETRTDIETKADEFREAVCSYLSDTARPMQGDGNAHDEAAVIAGRFADFKSIRTSLGELEAIRGAQKLSAPYVEAFKAAKAAAKANAQSNQNSSSYDGDQLEFSFSNAALSNASTAGANSSYAAMDSSDANAQLSRSSDDGDASASSASYSSGYSGRSFNYKSGGLSAAPNIGKAPSYRNGSNSTYVSTDLNNLISEDEQDDSIRELYDLHEELVDGKESKDSARLSDATNTSEAGAAQHSSAGDERSSQSRADEQDAQASNGTDAYAHSNNEPDVLAHARNGADVSAHTQSGVDTAAHLAEQEDKGYSSPYADQSAAVRSLYGKDRSSFYGSRNLMQEYASANRIEQMTLNKVAGMLNVLNDGTESNSRKTTEGTSSISERTCPTKFLHMVTADIALIMIEQRYFMVRCSELYYSLLMDKYIADVSKDQVRTSELTMPFSIRTDSILVKAYKQQDVQSAALRCGFSVKSSTARSCIDIQAVPEFVFGSNLAQVAVNALQLISAGTDAILTDGRCSEQLAYNLSRCKSISINTEYDARELSTKLQSADQLLSRAKDKSVKELNLLNLAADMLS